ncbi:MAG: hypothetical protein ACTHKT_11365 [Solirubrobacterales bacterium]
MTKRRIALSLAFVALLVAPVAWGYGASADDGPAENIPNALAAIEALPYPFTFSYPPRDTRKALIIRITDKLGKSFRFFLFAGNAPLDIGVPTYHREHLTGGQLGENYVMLNNESHEIRPETKSLPIRSYSGNSGITKAMEDEFFEIEFAVEDAVCELSEDHPCQGI